VKAATCVPVSFANALVEIEPTASVAIFAELSYARLAVLIHLRAESYSTGPAAYIQSHPQRRCSIRGDSGTKQRQGLIIKLLLEHLQLAQSAGGWMIDADHLVDFSLYLKRVGRKADLSLLKNGRYFKFNCKVMAPLHSWEITSALAATSTLVTDTCWVWLCAAIAHGLHLWLDQKTYGVRPTGYWLCLRFTYGFAHKGFCK